MAVKPADFPPLVVEYTGDFLAGVDEVGRGPLVGSVVAAAVILDLKAPIDGLTDSKKLTARRRESLDVLIRERALAFAVAEASAEEVDSLNIYHATHLAMRRAVDALAPQAEYLLVDGNRLPAQGLPHQRAPGSAGSPRAAGRAPQKLRAGTAPVSAAVAVLFILCSVLC